MRAVFCSDPFDASKPDPAYEPEASALRALGVGSEFISFEALVYAKDARKAVRRVSRSEGVTHAVYRGWMLKPEEYAALYGALLAQGLQMINTPEQYRHCHWLPESYPVIRQFTPESVWLPISVGEQPDFDQIMNLLRPFGDHPVIVKDYVKSRKHEWDAACFIPSAADREAVERVTRRFLELQEDDLNEGLVFRRFVELERIGTHPESGMPLAEEYRVFVLNNEPVYSTRYWEWGDYGSEEPPIDAFREVGRVIESRFFTMDLARKKDGGWTIMELGDGQVAGLPDHTDVSEFYSALKKHLE
jgi:hypothetical protein